MNDSRVLAEIATMVGVLVATAGCFRGMQCGRSASAVGFAATNAVVTSIVLIAGFMVLAFSAFVLNSNMALMTSVTILFAIVADFLLLPPLLMALDRKENINA